MNNLAPRGFLEKFFGKTKPARARFLPSGLILRTGDNKRQENQLKKKREMAMRKAKGGLKA